MSRKFSLIPRVRVNYGFGDVLKALFTSSHTTKGREETKRMLMSFFGVDDVLLTSSGRAGIYMILRFLPQKKVFIPAYTCMVVVEAAMLAEKEIHFVRTSGETFNSDQFQEVDKDSVIMATHQYGLPCAIEEIVNYAHKKGAVVVEDCAAAFGSRVNGKLVGTFGDYAAFSFDPSKLINVPNKAGFVISRKVKDLSLLLSTTHVREEDFAYKMSSLLEGCVYCLLKNKFVYRLFHYVTMGRNGKMQLSEHDKLMPKLEGYYTHGFAEWQSVFVNKQLRNVGDLIDKRKRVFKEYDKAINNPKITKPICNDEAICIRYTIRVGDKKSFYNACLAEGIDMGFSFNHIGAPSVWKKEHEIASEILNVPFYFKLSADERARIVNTINKF